MKDSEIIDWLQKNNFGLIAIGEGGRHVGWFIAGMAIKGELDLRKAVRQARRLKLEESQKQPVPFPAPVPPPGTRATGGPAR